MPTYEYRCERCGHTVEVVQSFSDGPLTTCESCGGSLRKVYAPVGIVFKGSGFYKTDSRSSSKSPKIAVANADAGGGSSEKPDKPEKKDEVKRDAVKHDGAAAASSSSKPDGSGSESSSPAATSGTSATRD
jgi:putative FmdB family regulatory protein